MTTVPTAREAEPPCDVEPAESHPEWCQRNHPGITMHRGPSDVVRNRDGIRVDAYLVSYGDQTKLSLDITPDIDATLIELDVPEAVRLHACLSRLLGHPERWQPMEFATALA